jgi:hypothetical protein
MFLLRGYLQRIRAAQKARTATEMGAETGILRA